MSVIERDFLVEDLLDRVATLESQMREMQEYSLSPQSAATPQEQGDWASISGWVITGDAIRDVDGRIVLSVIEPMIQIDSGGYIQSSDFEADTSGFQINGGTAEFNDVTVRGTIYATAGEIGGWTITSGHLYAGTGPTRAGMQPASYPFYAGDETPADAPFRVTPAGALIATNATITGTITATAGAIGGWSVGAAALTGGNATLHSTGYLLLGTGDDIARMDAADATYRLWIGDATAGDAPFRVTKTGVLTATGATITGTITATAGAIGGWTIAATTISSANITLDDGNDRIVVGGITFDGDASDIESSTYVAGLAGFHIDEDYAEFGNIHMRGSLHASVFVYGEKHATAGTLLVVLSAGKLMNDATINSASSPDGTLDIEDPDIGHTQLFSSGDVLYIQDGSGYATWMSIDSVTDNTTYYSYDVSYESGDDAVTYTAGCAVLDYGQSGDGGIVITADDANAPYVGIFAHAGSPWSTITDYSRYGNLNGWGGFSSDTWGIGIGAYAASYPNFYVDASNGVMAMRIYDTAYLEFDYNGGSPQANISGTLRMPGASSAIAIGSAPPASSSSGTGIWIDRTGFYSLLSDTYQVKIDTTTGAFYAGSGKVIVNVNGILIKGAAGGDDLIQWQKSDGTYIGGLESYWDSNFAYVYLDVQQAASGEAAYTEIRSLNDSGSERVRVIVQTTTSNAGNFEVYSYNAAGTGNQRFLMPGSGYITIDPDEYVIVTEDLRVGGGAYFGNTSTDPGSGVVGVDDYLYAYGGIHIGGNSDPGTDNLIVDGFIELGPASELTISSGAITVTGSYHRVDTEGDTASDDLDTINGGSEGDILILRAANSGRTVVVRTAVGNIYLNANFSLDHVADTLTLMCTGTSWLKVSSSSNA